MLRLSLTKLFQSPALLNTIVRNASCVKHPNDALIFRQLVDNATFTYTYILGDPVTKDAIIIDPVYEKVERDLSLINQLQLNLKYAVNTHVHADHVTGSGLLRSYIKTLKSVISGDSKGRADIYIKDGDVIKFGNEQIKCFSTPGHTPGCMTFVNHRARIVFTGDALLIRGCGRTDFQNGNPEKLYDSIHGKILSLPDDYIVFPGHDYGGQTTSSVGEEKKFNPRFIQSKLEFVETMKNLKLPKPRLMDMAVPRNLICGLHEEPSKQ